MNTEDGESAANGAETQVNIDASLTTLQTAESSGTEQQQQSSRQTSPPTPIKISKTTTARDRKKRAKAELLLKHIDIIKDDFWTNHRWILSGRTS